jgi:UDP-N-acetylmuramoylalanine--D-glutamate ligase
MYLLLGYGFSNKQVYKFLKTKRKKIIIYDDFIDNKKPHIEFSKIKIIVVSAGIHYSHPILIKGKELNIPIKTDLDILYKYKRKNQIFVGVTGSNGKSTTVTIISFLLNIWKINHLLCGNIGKSIFTNCYKKSLSVYVIEISSFQAHYMRDIRFNIGIIINISSNHDEWHEGKENYIKAKEKLLEFSQISLSYVNNPPSTYTSWKIDNNILNYQNNSYLLNNTLQLPHNQNNLLISLTVVEKIFFLLKKKMLIDKSFQEKINKFKSLSFRQEIIVNNKVLIVNDSKSTNIDSTITAINSFKHKPKLMLIMGGIIKGNLDLINPETLKSVESIYIFGESKKILEAHIQPFFPSYIIFDKLKDLVVYITENKEKYHSYTLLFSPGGASYDEFKNYIERGKYFNKLQEIFNISSTH